MLMINDGVAVRYDDGECETFAIWDYPHLQEGDPIPFGGGRADPRPAKPMKAKHVDYQMQLF